MDIHAILFDADGVIQRPSPGRREAWQRLLRPERSVDEFVEAAFDLERLALDGRSDFVAAFAGLVAESCIQGTLDDALAVWTMIDPDADMTEVVRAVQRKGIRCCLATNQEPHRASFMSTQLGYRGLFDQEFYSCKMGSAKPEHAYFDHIVDTLRMPAVNVLFIDDNEANVSAAQHVGLNAAQFLIDSGPAQLVRTLEGFGIHTVER